MAEEEKSNQGGNAEMHAEEPGESYASQFSPATEKFHQRISNPGDGGEG
jgi:hypothetical protein